MPSESLRATYHLALQCQMFGVGSIPWSPLGRGLLCRPFDAEATLRKKTDGCVAEPAFPCQLHLSTLYDAATNQSTISPFFRS